MAIGARDGIDKKLTQLYADKQTSNFDIKSKVDPEQVWQGMTMIAMNNKAFMQINNRKFAQKIA